MSAEDREALRKSALEARAAAGLGSAVDARLEDLEPPLIPSLSSAAAGAAGRPGRPTCNEKLARHNSEVALAWEAGYDGPENRRSFECQADSVNRSLLEVLKQHRTGLHLPLQGKLLAQSPWKLYLIESSVGFCLLGDRLTTVWELACKLARIKKKKRNASLR